MSDLTAEDVKQNMTRYCMRHICKMMREDPEYRQGWQANIAMAFMDEYDAARRGMEMFTIHEVANKAADRFLDLLTRDQKTSEPESGVFAQNSAENASQEPTT